MPGLTDQSVVWRKIAARRKWLGALVLIAVIYAGRGVWLRQMGLFLVRAESPQTADVAVVLAGDGYGHRIMQAAEFARQGYVKQVLVDSPRGFYGRNEGELAIEFAVSKGAPRELFAPLLMRARSTMAEIQAVDAALRKRNVRKALVVTSNYHTRRTRSILRRFGSPEVQYVVAAAPDLDFTPENWWRSRDAQKIVFDEYVKLLNWWLVD